MDEFDLLGDAGIGLEEFLDPQDLVDADANLAEVTAAGDVGKAAGGSSHLGLGTVKEVLAGLHDLYDVGVLVQRLVGDHAVAADVERALRDLVALPSPFEPV